MAVVRFRTTDVCLHSSVDLYHRLAELGQMLTELEHRLIDLYHRSSELLQMSAELEHKLVERFQHHYNQPSDVHHQLSNAFYKLSYIFAQP